MISGLILKSLIHFEIFLYVVWESSPVWFSCIELPSFPITIYWRDSCLLGVDWLRVAQFPRHHLLKRFLPPRCRLIDRLSVDSLLGFSALSQKISFSLISEVDIVVRDIFPHSHSGKKAFSFSWFICLLKHQCPLPYYQTWLVLRARRGGVVGGVGGEGGTLGNGGKGGSQEDLGGPVRLGNMEIAAPDHIKVARTQ